MKHYVLEMSSYELVRHVSLDDWKKAILVIYNSQIMKYIKAKLINYPKY
jgi:hypothetical protein